MDGVATLGRQWLRRMLEQRRLYAQPISAPRYDRAIRTMRVRSLAEGLLVFIAGFSIDDLQVLRYPGWIVGTVGAVALVAFGPLWHGIMAARNLCDADDAAFDRAMVRSVRRARLLLVAVIVLGTMWLVVFSEGVPAWAV